MTIDQYMFIYRKRYHLLPPQRPSTLLDRLRNPSTYLAPSCRTMRYQPLWFAALSACLVKLVSELSTPPPPYLHSWPHLRCNVGLKEGEHREKCLCLAILCIIIMVHKDTSSLAGRSTVWGFDLAYFSSLPGFRAPLCHRSSCCYIYVLIFLLTSFSLPFSELSLVRLALDLVD